MEQSSRKNISCASGGISSTATQLQDCSVTTPTSTTTLRTVNSLVREDRAVKVDKLDKELKAVKAHKVRELLPMTLSDQALVQVHLIQLPEDLRLKLQPSVAALLVQAVHIQPVHHRVTSRQAQLNQADLIQLLLLPDRTIQVKLRPVVPLAISRQAPLNIQALKVLIQAPVLLFHHPTCHHTSHHKDSHRNPILRIQPRALHRHQLENICHHDEDKLV